jgi:hypothetical protein
MYWSIITFSTVVRRLLHASIICASLSQARLELKECVHLHDARPPRALYDVLYWLQAVQYSRLLIVEVLSICELWRSAQTSNGILK